MKCKQWRQRMATQRKTLDALETVAIDLGIGDIVEPRDFANTLDDCEFGGGLEQFDTRVRRMAALLDTPPDDVESDASYGTVDLKAVWTITGQLANRADVRVIVRQLNSYDCKLDPNHPYVPAQDSAPHPECAHALDELEVELEHAYGGTPDAPQDDAHGPADDPDDGYGSEGDRGTEPPTAVDVPGFDPGMDGPDAEAGPEL